MKITFWFVELIWCHKFYICLQIIWLFRVCFGFVSFVLCRIYLWRWVCGFQVIFPFIHYFIDVAKIIVVMVDRALCIGWFFVEIKSKTSVHLASWEQITKLNSFNYAWVQPKNIFAKTCFSGGFLNETTSASCCGSSFNFLPRSQHN